MSAPTVRLRTPDAATLAAALAGPADLERALGCAVAPDWCGFPQALQHAHDALPADPASAAWGTRLFLLDDPATLAGWGGFKGAPQAGTVEIGYEVAPGPSVRVLEKTGFARDGEVHDERVGPTWRYRLTHLG